MRISNPLIFLFTLSGLAISAAGCGDSPTELAAEDAVRPTHEKAGHGVANGVCGPGSSRAVEAHWNFEGSGRDQTGQHPCALHGDATYRATPGGLGLYVEDAGSYAAYAPAIAEMASGRLTIRFGLADTFRADAAFNDPIILINSNRPGHLNGDFSIRLDPSDGKLWFTQEDPVVSPTWNLKAPVEVWPPGWYQVTVVWGPDGRSIVVDGENVHATVSDPVVSPCFASEATQTWIARRDERSPRIGVTIDKIKIMNPGRGERGAGAAGGSDQVETERMRLLR